MLAALAQQQYWVEGTARACFNGAVFAVRLSCAVGLVVGAALLVFPLLPWAGSVHAIQLWPGAPLAPLIMLSALALAAWLIPKHRAGYPQRDGSWPHWQATALAIGGLFLLQPLVHLALLGWSAWRPSPMSIDLVLPLPVPDRDAGLLASLLVFRVLLPSLIEEWFFRGRLLLLLQRSWGTASAITFSTVLFATIHGEIMQVIVALPVGALLAFVRIKTGSLYACIAAHFIHNFILLLLGGAAISLDHLALVMWLGGAWLLVFSWMQARKETLRRNHQDTIGIDRHLIMYVGIAFVLAAAMHIAYRKVKDITWTAAAHRLLIAPRLDAAKLFIRLDVAHNSGLLRRQRAAHLATALQHQGPQDPVVGIWFRAIIDSDGVLNEAAALPAGAYSYLRALATCPHTSRALSNTALALVGNDPPVLVDIGRENPEVLQHLLPLPDYQRQWVDIITVLEVVDRISLIEAVRMAWNREVASQLHFMLPAASVSRRDVLHMRRYNDDFQTQLNQLRQHNPQQASAWE